MCPLARVEAALPEFQEVTESIAINIEGIGALLRDATDASEQADLWSGTAAARLVVIGNLARDLDVPTSELEGLTTKYSELLSKINQSMFSIFAHIDGNPEELEDERVREFMQVLRDMTGVAREAMEAVNSFGVSAEGMSGISKRLRVPGRRLAGAVKRMAKATARMDEWDRRSKAFLGVEG